MRRRAALSTVAAAAAAALALAGCTATGSSGDGQVESSEVSTTVPDEDVTLELWYVNEPPVEALVDGFEKKHQNITVETTMVPFGDYIKSIKRAMSSDEAPDIAQFTPGAMRSLIPAGLIYNLDPYYEAYGWDEGFPESSLSSVTSNKEATKFDTGSLYAVPGALSVLGVFYNKDLLKKAGIDEAPQTVQEFSDALDKAEKAGIQPLSLGGLETGGFQLWNGLTNVLGDVQDYKEWVYGADGATIETEGAQEAAEKIVDWVDSGYIPQGASSVSDSDALANFANGESLFLVSGNWNVSELSETMGDDVGFFMLPGQTPDSEPVASGSSVSFSISSKTEHANAAAAFLDYMRSPEAAQIQVDGGFMPVNADVDVQVDGLGAQVAEGFRSVIDGAGIVPFPDYAAPGMIDKLTAGVQGMITGHMEPEEYLDSLQSEWASYHD